MKKMLVLLAAGALLCAVPGCGGSNSAEQKKATESSLPKDMKAAPGAVKDAAKAGAAVKKDAKAAVDDVKK